MSRSRKHTPIFGMAGDRSEKWSKRQAAKKMRRDYNHINFDDSIEFFGIPRFTKIYDIQWGGAKDGKAWADIKNDPFYSKYMRK